MLSQLKNSYMGTRSAIAVEPETAGVQDVDMIVAAGLETALLKRFQHRLLRKWFKSVSRYGKR